ncbi:hypothetical protein DM02DRAFT_661012 [Periconia macrospinosa]|uniref:FAS1 domain-containing protein n=1 Tax=Periconia macrospinosa TaxID=97972 RepID=A0A2V1D8L2_9PLEO|nr:hypothetical protein DM02DRAFT_661012 [Periconia macrospinosa]
MASNTYTEGRIQASMLLARSCNYSQPAQGAPASSYVSADSLGLPSAPVYGTMSTGMKKVPWLSGDAIVQTIMEASRGILGSRVCFLTAFRGALNATGLANSLVSVPDVTIFAPNNEAFTNINSAIGGFSGYPFSWTCGR